MQQQPTGENTTNSSDTTMSSSTAASDDEAVASLRTERMRQRTQKVHDHSVDDLKLGLILTSKALYAETLSLFAPIFSFLEDALERNQSHPQLGLLYPLLEELRRGPRFQRDVDFYRQEHQVIVRLPEVDDYLQHLETLEKERPVALLAYMYHMYMAIFAGGYIIKKMVMKTMRLSGEQGVQVYGHEKTEAHVLRKQLKDVINNMSLTDQEDEMLMEESMQVFSRNDALIATVQQGAAFSEAQADCCRFLTKVSVAVIVVVAAVGVALLKSSS